MNGNTPADYRLLFPLAPVLAVAALSFVEIPAPARGSARESDDIAPSLCSEKKVKSAEPPLLRAPSAEAIAPPKYRVKFMQVSHEAMGYDAGSKLLSVYCLFSDFSENESVVGISEMGLITRLQTDTGMVFEGPAGFGIISPNVHKFQNAQFFVQTKVPLATKSISVLNGAITVLRARERSVLSWREPFGAQIGAMRPAGDFEFTLTKCEISNDVITAEWRCKPPVDVVVDAKLWESRQLTATLTTADKSALPPEKSAQNATVIQRRFRLGKKFPIALELSFINDLQTENLPFVLSGFGLDGKPIKKDTTPRGENF